MDTILFLISLNSLLRFSSPPPRTFWCSFSPSSDPVITMEPASLHRIALDEPCLLHCGQHSSQPVSLSLTTFGHRYKPISLYHLASIPDRFNCTACSNNNNTDTGLRQWPLFFAMVDTTTGLLPHSLQILIILRHHQLYYYWVCCSSSFVVCTAGGLLWCGRGLQIVRRMPTRTLTTNVVKQILTRCQRREQDEEVVMGCVI